MSLGRQRFSIIPAMAVTDRRLQPRDLQVLCLLGRHTDNNGWCCRSQVKMAKELACGRSTLQRALDRLYEAGYVEYRANERHSGASAAHDYRVVIDPPEASQSGDCSHQEDTETGSEIGPENGVDFRETPLPIDGHPLPTGGHPCPPKSGHPLPTHERAPMLTTQDKRYDDDDDACAPAREPSDPVSRKIDKSPQASLAGRGKRVCEAMGIAFDDPNWKGDFTVLVTWDAQKFDFELDVLPVIADVSRRRRLKGQGPVASLNYFTNEIRNAKARREGGDQSSAKADLPQTSRFGKSFQEQAEADHKAALREVFGEVAE
ncbi:helix-turn-helix domain-containing protein [uncultured Roseibium sp.]|uniref:helix-turn-helix domain-containing protein n=1 Tax=uncultured Roseibium sp. TaxID=1936171 RepID=UPI002612609F|nr:helix-turn-helix domain-containing protein [uncultured Roseibium sp.]